MVVFTIKSLVLLSILSTVSSWDLSHFGIKNYTALQVSVFKNRAFVSIKAHQDNFIDLKTYPSLIEVSWPDSLIYNLRAKAFPLQQLYNKRNCEFLLNVISTSVDVLGRLWILDEGTNKCPGKLVVYNLHSNRVLQVFLIDNEKYQLASMVIDPSILMKYQRAYIGVSNRNMIIICPLRREKCYVQNLNVMSDNPYRDNIVTSEFMALSKRYNYLFISPLNSPDLYVIELESIDNNNKKLDAFYIGEKLGPSTGLMLDQSDNLCYYLRRDYVIVCWENGKPLNAEGHYVMLQSYQKLPSVSQLFLDPQNIGWAIVNSEDNSIEPTCIEFL